MVLGSPDPHGLPEFAVPLRVALAPEEILVQRAVLQVRAWQASDNLTTYHAKSGVVS
jgi:hypothetical protein